MSAGRPPRRWRNKITASKGSVKCKLNRNVDARKAWNRMFPFVTLSLLPPSDFDGDCANHSDDKDDSQTIRYSNGKTNRKQNEKKIEFFVPFHARLFSSLVFAHIYLFMEPGECGWERKEEGKIAHTSIRLHHTHCVCTVFTFRADVKKHTENSRVWKWQKKYVIK